MKIYFLRRALLPCRGKGPVVTSLGINMSLERQADGGNGALTVRHRRRAHPALCHKIEYRRTTRRRQARPRQPRRCGPCDPHRRPRRRSRPVVVSPRRPDHSRPASQPPAARMNGRFNSARLVLWPGTEPIRGPTDAAGRGPVAARVSPAHDPRRRRRRTRRQGSHSRQARRIR